MSTCYTLNSTADVIRKTVKVLYDLDLDGFSTDCEDDKCLVVWCDKTFTTVSQSRYPRWEWDGRCK